MFLYKHKQKMEQKRFFFSEVFIVELHVVIILRLHKSL